jgi:uncharacterized protein YeaO (DUF488 family)
VLVDRLWPRGVSKDHLALNEWAKELAPSDKLRRWFNHDPNRWPEFHQRYFQELDAQAASIVALLKKSHHRPLLLIYGARDTEHNNAVVLCDYLNQRTTS